MPIMHIYLLEGRSEDQKASLIASLTDAAVRTLGVKEDTVRVAITDMPRENFGIGGKTAKALGR